MNKYFLKLRIDPKSYQILKESTNATRLGIEKSKAERHEVFKFVALCERFAIKVIMRINYNLISLNELAQTPWRSWEFTQGVPQKSVASHLHDATFSRTQSLWSNLYAYIPLHRHRTPSLQKFNLPTPRLCPCLRGHNFSNVGPDARFKVHAGRESCSAKVSKNGSHIPGKLCIRPFVFYFRAEATNLCATGWSHHKLDWNRLRGAIIGHSNLGIKGPATQKKKPLI